MGTIIQSRLRLTFQTGLDEFGDPTYRSKAYANVRPAASDEDVATAAIALSSLTPHRLAEMTRHNTVLLQQET